jgi:hypothetical protein
MVSDKISTWIAMSASPGKISFAGAYFMEYKRKNIHQFAKF